ncbi:hypothetical protein E2C01_041254 [Portunus trituberculatus]|uniref:Uncharacterized protein n=1 Tax=Portunus trituberculatus TaxID=210409 RepID=A0A5B7FPX3_PORTR|nr:hypothetical protein [Portunus trituberculatus]
MSHEAMFSMQQLIATAAALRCVLAAAAFWPGTVPTFGLKMVRPSGGKLYVHRLHPSISLASSRGIIECWQDNLEADVLPTTKAAPK